MPASLTRRLAASRSCPPWFSTGIGDPRGAGAVQEQALDSALPGGRSAGARRRHQRWIRRSTCGGGFNAGPRSWPTLGWPLNHILDDPLRSSRSREPRTNPKRRRAHPTRCPRGARAKRDVSDQCLCPVASAGRAFAAVSGRIAAVHRLARVVWSQDVVWSHARRVRERESGSGQRGGRARSCRRDTAARRGGRGRSCRCRRRESARAGPS